MSSHSQVSSFHLKTDDDIVGILASDWLGTRRDESLLCPVQVVTEAYVARDVQVPQHQLMSLILCKIGDSDKASCLAMCLYEISCHYYVQTCCKAGFLQSSAIKHARGIYRW